MANKVKLYIITGACCLLTSWLETPFRHFILGQDYSLLNAINNKTFNPGTKSRWQAFSEEEILLITNGSGFYQEAGKAQRLIKKGDIIECMPHVMHWYGASKEGALSFITISTNAPQTIGK